MNPNNEESNSVDTQSVQQDNNTQELTPIIDTRENKLESDSKPTDEEEQKKYIITKRFNDWVTYYTTPGHYIEVKNNKGEIEKRKTYGNKTASAIKAYELDYEKQYGSAATIGKENFKKHQYLASRFAEDEGLTDDFMIQVLKAKMGEKGTKAWEIMADIVGLRTMTPDTLIQNNTQVNNYSSDDPKAIDFNTKFRKFLEQE